MHVPDPFGILESTAGVMAGAHDVSIDHMAIGQFVASFGDRQPEPTAWDNEIHFQDTSPGGAERVAGWIFALDALNFCFWSTTDERWRVTWRGRMMDGYRALAAALSRAVADGCHFWDPAWLRNLSYDDVAHILRPDPGSPVIPLLDLRHRHLVELGEGLGEVTAAGLIRSANGSCITLIRDVLDRFPSFRDVATDADGMPVPFYKRAQILVADLGGALAEHDLGVFHDHSQLTAFADYKVPQVLRQLGILVYSEEASATVQRRQLVPAGSQLELEIRAATIQGCESIRQALALSGTNLTASEIDWLLWAAGQALPATAEPYHRTLTPFY